MGERYWISGVQLGMLMAYAEQLKSDEIKKLLESIEKDQYLCEAEELERRMKD